MDHSIYQFLVRFVSTKFDFDRPTRILEAGCGNGLFANEITSVIAGKPVTYFAFDLARQLVANSKEINLQVKHSVTALPCAPYRDGLFDLIYFSEVLEHCAEPLASLRELRRMLRDDGSLILTIPNGDRWGIDCYLRNRHSFQPADDYYYTFAEIQNLLRRAGFRIHDFRGYGGGIPVDKKAGRLGRLWTALLNRFILPLHPDAARKHKNIVLFAKKYDYFLNHDF